MANFIISPLAISFDSIKNNLQAYVASKPENETWKDFYASSAGETILEIASALGAFYAFHFIAGRRESYLPVAQNYTSVVGLAENDGYSCDRGTNLQISINLVPNQTVTLPKWTIIGSYTEYDIVITEDVILNKGVATNVPVVIGNLLNEDLSITTNKLAQFSFLNPNTTETFRLLLNGNEVPTSTEIKDLLNDKWGTLTNVYGSFDTFYLQEGDYKYNPGDTLTSQFIERNSLNYGKFSPSNLAIDYASQVNECTLIKDLQEVESIDQIKLKAPLYHETSMVIRSRKDYSKYLAMVNPSLLQANDRDVNPGLIELTYLKRDGSIMSDEEKEYWLDLIEESRPSGVARATISEPIKVSKTLNISLWKSSSENISATISDEIDELLSKYDNKFEIEIDLNQVEHDIEKLQGIKIARVEISPEKWKKSTNYKNYDLVQGGDNIFYVSDFQYSSGSSEPNWPKEIGGTVIDNELVWEKVNDYESTVVHTWHPKTNYSKFDYIRKDVLTEGNYAISGQDEPEWGSTTIEDNNLVWTKTEEEGTKNWAVSRAFFLGDIIKVTTTELIDDVRVPVTYNYKCTKCYQYEEANIYMVKNYVSKSGTSEPSWGASEVYDNKLVWTRTDVTDSYTSYQTNHSYQIGDAIKVNGLYYVISSFIGTSGTTEPVWANAVNGQITDNNLVWSIMDSSQRTLSLQWNQYLNLSKTYEIVG